MNNRWSSIFTWLFFPSLAEEAEESQIMANAKLHAAVDALKASDAAKSKQIADLTVQASTLTASGVTKDTQIAALTAEVASDGTAIDPLKAQVADLAGKLSAANTQIDTLTKAASDNDADDNALAGSIATA